MVKVLAQIYFAEELQVNASCALQILGTLCCVFWLIRTYFILFFIFFYFWVKSLHKFKDISNGYYTCWFRKLSFSEFVSFILSYRIQDHH